MKGSLNFIKTTVIGGFFVVLPTALVLFLIGLLPIDPQLCPGD